MRPGAAIARHGGDAEDPRSLAIDLGAVPFRPAVESRGQGDAEAGDLSPARVVELLVRRFSGSLEDDWPRGLEVLTRAVGGRAAILGLEGPDELPIAVAAYGPVEAITRHRAVVAGVKRESARRGSGVRGFRVGGDDPVDFALTDDPGGGFLGLAVWGATEPEEAVAELLRAGVLLADRLLRPHAPPPAVSRPAAGPEAPLRFPPGYVVGTSEPCRALHRDLAGVVRSDLSVLLCGETGTGKEMLARMIHLSSRRAGGPFLAINCAAIPDTLLEAELFGVERRIATGVEPRQGRFEQARGGTLFLDEIGEMPPALQVKLLRVLQEREVQPLGGSARRIDVRVVAATNRDLREAMAEGDLRPDLYYRLAGVEIFVPPIRRRRADVPALVRHFLDRALDDAGKRIRGVSLRAMEHLVAYAWPGNVRELEHEVRRLAFACPEGGVIDSSHLRPALLREAADPPELVLDRTARADFDLKEYLEGIERGILEEALARAGGNQSRAAEDLGLSRNGLAKKIKRFGIEPRAAVKG